MLRKALGAIVVATLVASAAPSTAAPAAAETPPAAVAPVTVTAEAHSELQRRYAALYQAWEKERDPKSAEAPVSQLLEDQRLALGEQAVETLLTERMLADVKYDLGEPDLALTLIDHAVAGLTRANGDADTETLLARMVRVKILRDRARWREAALECEAVLVLAEHNPNRRPWRAAQNELMYMYDKVGRLGDAAAIGERALREGSADYNDVIAAVLLDRLAGVYLGLARNEEALELQQRAQDLFVANYGPDHEATLSMGSNLATALWAAGRHEEVIALERDLVRRRQAIADVRPRNALIARDLLGEHLLLLGRLDEAEAEFQAVLPLWIEKFGPRDPDTNDVRYFLARIASERGQLAEARVALEDVCPLYETLGDTYEGAPQHCRERLADVLWSLGERERALRMLGDSLTGFEQRLETGHLSDRSEQAVFADRAPSFRRWAQWLIVSGKTQAAFAVSERLRARTLLQSIVLRHADASPVLPAPEALQLAQLKSKLATVDEAMSEESNPARRALLSAEREQAFRELVVMRTALGKRFPAYAALSAVRSVDPAEASRLLPANTAAVTYLIGDDHLFALVVTRRRPLSTIDLGSADGLRESVDAAQVLMGKDPSRRVWRQADGRLAVGPETPRGRRRRSHRLARGRARAGSTAGRAVGFAPAWLSKLAHRSRRPARALAVRGAAGRQPAADRDGRHPLRAIDVRARRHEGESVARAGSLRPAVGRRPRFCAGGKRRRRDGRGARRRGRHCARNRRSHRRHPPRLRPSAAAVGTVAWRGRGDRARPVRVRRQSADRSPHRSQRVRTDAPEDGAGP